MRLKGGPLEALRLRSLERLGAGLLGLLLGFWLSKGEGVGKIKW